MEEEIIKLLNTYYYKRRVIHNDFNACYNLSLSSKRLVTLNNKYSKLIKDVIKKKPSIHKYNLLKIKVNKDGTKSYKPLSIK